MPIDIAYYIQKIQIQTAATIKESEKKLKEKGKLLDEDRINFLLRGAVTTAKVLEQEIYREVKQKESRSYDYCSNEMTLLALATILAAWSGWVFKSKSEDQNRPTESGNKQQRLPTTEDVAEIKKIVSRIITRSCIKYNRSKAMKYYGDLFNLKNNVPQYRNATQNIGGPVIFENIVTTNYDLVVDNYYAETDKPLFRGFEEDVKSHAKILNLRRIQTRSTEDEIQYVQLHGSIDWWLRDRDNQIVLRENPESFRGERYPGQIMVYPIYEKYISQDPYFSLYYYFRRLLYSRDIYIVIGYSFRDPSINNAFGDALRDKSESRMIIVNP